MQQRADQLRGEARLLPRPPPNLLPHHRPPASTRQIRTGAVRRRPLPAASCSPQRPVPSPRSTATARAAPTTRAAPRRQNSQQPTSCNAVVLREDQRGGGGGAISVLRVDFRRGAVSVSKIGVVSAAAAVGNFGFAGFFRLSRSNKNE